MLIYSGLHFINEIVWTKDGKKKINPHDSTENSKRGLEFKFIVKIFIKVSWNSLSWKK